MQAAHLGDGVREEWRGSEEANQGQVGGETCDCVINRCIISLGNSGGLLWESAFKLPHTTPSSSPLGIHTLVGLPPTLNCV